jgi:hypothetical protein
MVWSALCSSPLCESVAPETGVVAPRFSAAALRDLSHANYPALTSACWGQVQTAAPRYNLSITIRSAGFRFFVEEKFALFGDVDGVQQQRGSGYPAGLADALQFFFERLGAFGAQ